MADFVRSPTGYPVVCASPLQAVPRIREGAEGRLVADYLVGASEPVLAGHFPGLAIFPGVCLIECAHLTALEVLAAAGAGDPPHRLAAIESARFLRPVFPGDEVRAEVSLGGKAEGGWICAARVSTGGAGGADAGVFRLRYQDAGPAA